MNVFTLSESALEHIFNAEVFEPATILLPRDFANLCLPASPSEDVGSRKKGVFPPFSSIGSAVIGRRGIGQI